VTNATGNGVPGSGRLSDEERVLLARAHTLVPLTPDTMMFKVLPPGALRIYLANAIAINAPGEGLTLDHRTVGGYVARAVDAEELTTPAAFIKAFRWDYPTSGYHLNAARIHVMEFLAGPVDRYTIPFGAPAHPDPAFGIPFDSPEVARVADQMVAAAVTAGVDPAVYARQIDFWPFTGTGLTPNMMDGLPVWWRRYEDLAMDTVIYEYDTAGTKNPVARYTGHMSGWKDLR
jgi:hypothetical protein